uniref:Uncharacterized protein n=1 Tax=Anopheles funestus TaxID=62324 RepID=A0A182S080_ANOFN
TSKHIPTGIDATEDTLSHTSWMRMEIGECKPMEGEEEIDKITFDRWRDILESATALAGINGEVEKANIFKMKARSKLRDMLNGTFSKSGPDAVPYPYSNAIQRLEDYFGSRDYVLFQRQKLRSMPQGADEADLKINLINQKTHGLVSTTDHRSCNLETNAELEDQGFDMIHPAAPSSHGTLDQGTKEEYMSRVDI